jgi:uncharacterized protein GlcG (DUF336 family)
LLFITGCGGGGSGSGNTAENPTSECTGFCANANSFLTVSDIQIIIARAVGEATSLNAPATIAVVDRVGNVLAVFRMAGANNPGPQGADFGFVTISSERNPLVSGGLENLAIIPDTAAAIAKAVTGAFLSSEGNAFSTRTASQIVQQNFNPGESNQPGGPLFGVQFSSLPCSDLNTRFTGNGAGPGPQRSPLGLAADPGGLPLYKNGTPVGGIGVISDGLYSLDNNIGDIDRDQDELIALAGTFGFAAPANRQAERITVDGKTLRFADAGFSDLASDPSNPMDFATGVDNLLGSLVSVPGYFDGAIITGTAFGQPDSGIAPADEGLFPGRDAFVLVDAAGSNRFPPIAGTLLSEEEVITLLRSALDIANRARAQIRQPASSQMRASISVVDTDGEILGIVRTRDAPVFGLDVSLQKARTAAFFSGSDAASDLDSAPDARYLNADGTAVIATVPIGSYVTALRNFIGLPTALADGAFAFSDRAGGNLSRPYFPDGIIGNPNGPLSKPFPQWSPFSDGLQLDLVLNSLVDHVLFLLGAAANDVSNNCTGIAALPNGNQIFPGSVPIYKGNVLAGAIGVSGDGVDQDDMTAFLGLHNAGITLSTVNNAPAEMRADRIVPPAFGLNLRYIQCPQAPFLNSNEQTPCAGK